MALRDTLTGWNEGPPLIRDDGGLVIVELRKSAHADGQPHYGLPITAARWSAKSKTTGGAPHLDGVLWYIDITA